MRGRRQRGPQRIAKPRGADKSDCPQKPGFWRDFRRLPNERRWCAEPAQAMFAVCSLTLEASRRSLAQR